MPEEGNDSAGQAEDKSESDKDKNDSEPVKQNDDGEEKDPAANNEKSDKNENETETSKQKKGGEEKDPEANSEKTSDNAKKTPKGIYFILGNEFCERFSFYGMRTILTLFLTLQLDYSGSDATTIYHTFQSLCYFTPLLGAILADSWLGRFRTIFYISILYAIGNVIISVGAIPHPLHTMRVLSIIGLMVISIGTGGIKPCVSAFGGDQFTEGQEEQRRYFFSIFYFFINLGSFLSTAITPSLRGDIKCFGQDTCFSLAFFIPAVLFAIALVLFLIGKPLYIIKKAEGSAFVSVFKCMFYALFRKATVKDQKKDHWLEYADDKYDKNLIYDVKCLLNVLFIYIPLPIFWALFEQQGSKWVLQASKMDGEIFGTRIKPDHMQLVNPVFILILIPVFDYVVYPLASRCNICHMPLQRMVIGGLLSSLSFLIAAIIEWKIEAELPVIPPKGFSDLTIINNSPCNLNLHSRATNTSLAQFAHTTEKDELGKSAKWQFVPTGCSANATVDQEFNVTSQFETMMITLENNQLKVLISNDSRIKEKDGSPRVRFLFSIDYKFTEKENASFLFQGGGNVDIFPSNMTLPGSIGMTGYYSVKPSKYKLYLPTNDAKKHEEIPFGEIQLKNGGSYVVYIYQKQSNSEKAFNHLLTMMPNSVHILWQIPQGIIITCGEVMYSITGLEFSYSQAPSSMKSLIQAAWLLTNAIGNLLVVVLLRFIEFEKQSFDFLLFSVLMAFAMLVFGIMAYYYKYVEEKGDPEKEK